MKRPLSCSVFAAALARDPETGPIVPRQDEPRVRSRRAGDPPSGRLLARPWFAWSDRGDGGKPREKVTVEVSS